MFVQYLFVFVCFLIDGVLATLFPVGLLNSSFHFIPSLGLCALVLVVRRMKMIDSILITLISGLVYSYFFTNTYFVYALIFLIITLIVKYWFRNVGDSFIECLVICTVTIFIKEILCYIIFTITNDLNLSITNWIIYRSFLTILLNDILFIVLYAINNIKDYYLQEKQVKMSKAENLHLYRYR